MARIAYVNGRYTSIGAPAVRIEDRGYQFADGVYEVIKAIDGVPRDLDRHFARLRRSLAELEIPLPMSLPALRQVIGETLRRNRLRAAIVYVQVSRGIAPRSHLWSASLKPSIAITVRRAPFPKRHEIEDGVAVVTLPDIRWKRCDIKSVSLLPNVLAKQAAARADAREAWFYDQEGYVTEGSSANAWIVDRDGRLVTRPKSEHILGGITRDLLFEVAAEAGIEIVERPFTVDEAKDAREAFLTSTSSLVLPVTRIDDRVIGNGRPGSVTMRLLCRYAALEGLDSVAGLSEYAKSDE